MKTVNKMQIQNLKHFECHIKDETLLYQTYIKNVIQREETCTVEQIKTFYSLEEQLTILNTEHRITELLKNYALQQKVKISTKFEWIARRERV